ncbi:hypothetical protein PVAND_014595 [Polypedilum vanderplanki]|uniref:Uncharacterized protein n=1 Tax=Polypedilum vanderplanki TaxID=319348 RepID=A0A9J6B9M5_POLVA|nr:hypothetical protein PVAND_014595 [Polypedilum vanderplanki]
MIQQTSPFFMGTNSNIGEQENENKKLENDTNLPISAEKMQEFLLQKFSNQDFDLLTKNYDTFLQYYKTNCPTEQLMDDKHLSMDFLTQFYHLNEFKRKLNGGEFMEQESNMSDDDGADDVVALDDSKDESEGNQMTGLMDLTKGKLGVTGMHSNKRLRTTILPEQLNFLYECYQKESNPSRKQLEEIAKKVNLKKRVVQVWYQNSRARERKGQFRQNMQIINKKCPYCSAIFKVKSALESHLQTKHADKQMVNIDTIPEISFNQAQQEQLQNIDLSLLNIPTSATSPDFWKSKLMQQPQTSTSFNQPKRIDFSESEISFTDSNNEELGEEDYDFDNFNDDSNHGDGTNANGNGNTVDKEKSKRHRTHVNRVQKSILRKIFDDVKTPSMIDCENIGREIGLFKRVVQVWFQNARANYKKFHNLSANDLKKLPDKNPSDCMYCSDYVPTPTKSYNSHVLSQGHIQNIHNYVMKNESHEADDDGDEQNSEQTFHITEHDMMPRDDGNFNAYTNCHSQQSQLVGGDTHWID